MAHQDGAYPGFCSMKSLRVILPPGWDASPSQGYPLPQHKVYQYPFIHLGKEQHCESKVAATPTTQSGYNQAP